MTETETPVDIPIDQIIQRYIALRDKKAELVAAHKAEVAKFDVGLERCELFLLKTMQSMGVESIRSELGTAYKSTRTSAGVADWPAALDFIKGNEHWEMLEKRVSKAFVEAYRTEHNDLPPGINWREETTVNIRRT